MLSYFLKIIRVIKLEIVGIDIELWYFMVRNGGDKWEDVFRKVVDLK